MCKHDWYVEEKIRCDINKYKEKKKWRCRKCLEVRWTED